MTNRVTGSGRPIEAGQLGVYRQDFKAHVEGGDWRHTADQVDVNPILPGITGTTVQQVLAQMDTLIAQAGHNVVTIGSLTADGYARGNYNVGSLATPTFVGALNAALADSQLAFGGVILILAGLYHLTSSVILPPGISLVGEIAGTIISGETTEQPMFVINSISSALGIGGDTGGGQVPILSGSNYNQCKLYNLILVDKWNGSSSSMTTVPMVRVKNGANFSCERVSFIGRINNGALSGRFKTFQAIGSASGSGLGTTVSVTDCFFDGLKTGINFTPGNGAIDSLTVSRCRARTFGSETSADQTGESNSFIVSTLCNSIIKDNYVVGGGAFSLFLITYTSSGNTTATSVISGNTGFTPSISSSSLVKNNSGQVLNAIISNNNWNLSTESWYIVVGGGNGQYPLGDVNGSSAIDVILNLPTTFQATVYVYPGTYNVTVTANNNLQFIGLKKGSNYPIFNLNASSGTTDIIGNRQIIFGNYLKSIAFTSVSHFHSVTPCFNSATGNPAESVLIVEDCIFDDASLLPLSPGIPLPINDILGNQGRWEINVISCKFNQTGNFSTVTVSCVLPSVQVVSVEKCFFTGNKAYHLSIGPGFTITSPLPSQPLYNIENCYFEMGGANTFSPLGSGFNSVVLVQDYASNPKICFKDCQILVDPGEDVTTGGWGNTLLANSSYTGFFGAWIRLSGGEIEVKDSLISGSGETFYTRSGVNYGTITLALEPQRRVAIDNCYFIGGAVPVQIGGDNVFQFKKDGIFISNSTFNTFDQANIQTCLDIDLNIIPPTDITVSGNLPIRINNNSFFINPLNSFPLASAQHRNAVSSIYNACGCVQVYAGQADIAFTDNKVEMIQRATSAGFANQSAVVLNNYDNTSTAGVSVAPIVVSGNTIYCDNFVSSSTSTNTSSALFVRSNEARIENNHLALYNQASFLNSFVGCLVIDVQQTPNSGYGMVSGNVFSRQKTDGTLSQLKRGYVQITNGTSMGMIINNLFDDPGGTFDGTTTTLVEDNNIGPNKWTVTQNKNQIETVNLYGFVGKMANETTSSDMTILGSYPTNLVVRLLNPTSLPNTAVELSYTSGTANYYWFTSLFEALPRNVKINKVALTITPSGTFTNGTFNFRLTGLGLTTQNGSPAVDITAGNPVSSTINPTNSANNNTYLNTAANGIQLELSCANISSGSARTIDIRPLAVTYQW